MLLLQEVHQVVVSPSFFVLFLGCTKPMNFSLQFYLFLLFSSTFSASQYFLSVNEDIGVVIPDPTCKELNHCMVARA